MDQVQPIAQDAVKILRQRNEYAKTVYFVQLQPAVRRNFTDQQIVNIVDAGGDVRQAYVQNNFGGSVSLDKWPDTYRVAVFTD